MDWKKFVFGLRFQDEAGEGDGGGAGTNSTENNEMTNQVVNSKIDTEGEGDPAPRQTSGDQGDGEKVYFEYQGKRFNSQQEVADYIASIEDKYAQQSVTRERQEFTPTQESLEKQLENADISQQEKDELAEKIFTNPREVLDRLEQRLEEKWARRTEQEKNRNKFWEAFYQEAPDLRNADRVVQSIARERWEEIKKLPVSKAREELAKDARALVEKIRGETGKEKTLKSGGATALSSTHGSAPKTPIQPQKPKSFIDQVREFQSR